MEEHQGGTHNMALCSGSQHAADVSHSLRAVLFAENIGNEATLSPVTASVERVVGQNRGCTLVRSGTSICPIKVSQLT